MERHELLEMTSALKLSGMRSAFDETLLNGLKRRRPVHDIIGELLKAEIAEKRARSIMCCTSTGLVFAPRDAASEAAAGEVHSHPLALWDDSGNGRITCREARRHGIAPVRKGHPAYVYMRDADGDGVVCE